MLFINIVPNKSVSLSACIYVMERVGEHKQLLDKD